MPLTHKKLLDFRAFKDLFDSLVEKLLAETRRFLFLLLFTTSMIKQVKLK